MTDDTTTAEPARTVEDDITAVRMTRTIAANVRAELARQDVSAATVAANLHRHRNTVTKRLAGEIPYEAHEIFILARLLNVTTDSLFSGV